MLARYLELIVYRSMLNLRSEASKTYLGIIWWILEPILYLGVFYLIFGLGYRQGGEGFMEFLLCGLVAWKWFESTIRSCVMSISGNIGLMGQVYLPKVVFPASIILTNLVKFSIIFTIFVVFLAVLGVYPGSAWLYLPIVIFVELILICALSLLGAAVVPIIPDLSHVINYAMLMLFFVSGIFFDIKTMSETVQDMLIFNPVVTILNSFRQIMLHNQPPELLHLFIIFLVSVVVLLLVSMLYIKLDRIYPKVVN